MTTQIEPKIYLEGITVDELLSRMQSKQPAQTTANNEETFTVQEAAKFLKVSVPTIWRLKALNKIPYSLIGTRVLFSRVKLIEWMNSNQAGANA